jgi:Na+-driven multidrug efflux pump
LVDALAVAAQTLVAEELGKGSISRARQVADRLLQALELKHILFF